MKSADSNKPAIFSGLMTDYTGQLESTQGFSLNTTKSYKDGLYTLLVYFDEVKHLPNDAISFSHLSLSEINGYLDWLENTRKCSIQTRNHRLAILKSFAKYSSKYNFRAAGEFYSAVYKIPTKRAKGKKRAFFSIEEAFIFMSLPKFNTLAGRRDSVLLVFMYFTAARAQEVCDLRVKDLEYLESVTDAKGRKLEVIKIHVPNPITITKEESEGVDVVDGTFPRNEGDRLPASYINYYNCNGAIILPIFNDEHDQAAINILQDCFPDRVIETVYAREILLGGGDIHCITQQVPKA